MALTEWPKNKREILINSAKRSGRVANKGEGVGREFVALRLVSENGDWQIGSYSDESGNELQFITQLRLAFGYDITHIEVDMIDTDEKGKPAEAVIARYQPEFDVDGLCARTITLIPTRIEIEGVVGRAQEEIHRPLVFRKAPTVVDQTMRRHLAEARQRIEQAFAVFDEMDVTTLDEFKQRIHDALLRVKS